MNKYPPYQPDADGSGVPEMAGRFEGIANANTRSLRFPRLAGAMRRDAMATSTTGIECPMSDKEEIGEVVFTSWFRESS